MFFPAIHTIGRKAASSSHKEGKPPALTGDAPTRAMRPINCCQAPVEGPAQHSWWRGASGCIGSGTLLVLLPKCPMCIAAYLALFTGAAEAMPLATRLRPIMEILFAASAILLLVRTARFHGYFPFGRRRTSSDVSG
jgi:hypothetical protein